VFSNSIDSVRIITSEGEVWEVGRDSAAFDHVALSLGALGIISTITFRCEEKFFLELQMRVVPFERFLLERETLDEDNEFFSAVWSPYAGRVLTFQGNRVPNQPRSGSRRERFCLLHCIHHQISRLPCLGAFPLRWSGLTVVDECYRILSPIQKKSGKTRVLRTLGKLVRAVEFAVPLSKAGELLTALHGLLLSENWAVPLPIGLRASAKDSLSLSPAFGRDSFWIDMFLFPDSRLEKSLAGLFEEFDARCHWGKHIGLSRDHLLRQYPRWEEFWTFRNSLDPDRIFANDFTRSLEP
jgi:L-gulonolactone oxidase